MKTLSYIVLCQLLLLPTIMPEQSTGFAANPAKARAFLAKYTNPKEAQATARDPLGLYPHGPRMWLSGYNDGTKELQRMADAGMTLSGPHYGNAFPHPNCALALSKGMKSYYRLFVGSGWRNILKTFYKTTPAGGFPTGRAYQEARVRKYIENVLQDKDAQGNPAPGLNDAVVAWYNPADEPMGVNAGKGYDRANQLEFIAAIHQVIKDTDTKKRPFMLSNRGDSSGYLPSHQYVSDVCLKQNYHVRDSKWSNYPELNTPWDRYIVGEWIRRQYAAAASYNGGISPYTGYEIPIITTLSMYIDPSDPTWHTKQRIQLMLEHDFWLSIAMGAHGVILYTWRGGAAGVTQRNQENVYMNVIRRFTSNNLPAVFLWGDDRTDIKMNSAAAKQKLTWAEYRKKHTEPSIKFRNIQYGNERTILLVNSDPADTIPVTLSGFPTECIQYIDLTTGVSSPFAVGRGKKGEIRVTLHPLEYAIYKVTLTQNR